MSSRQTLADEVRGILRKQGPSTIDEIHAQSERARSRTQLANNLYQMSLSGHLKKQREGKQVVYRLPTQRESRAPATGAAPKSGEASSKKAAAKEKAASAARTNGGDRTLGNLEENLRRTQAALDAYVESVAEPSVYQALIAARDHASESFQAHVREDEP